MLELKRLKKIYWIFYITATIILFILMFIKSDYVPEFGLSLIIIVTIIRSKIISIENSKKKD